MYAVIGLGNPGKQYVLTRHNIGFLVVDKLSSRLGLSSKEFKKGENYLFAVCGEGKEKILLVKPQTYVNRSGEVAFRVKSYYRLENRHILVVVDDYYQPFGKIRIRTGGSSGGHNGLKSIETHLGTHYPRIRCGIGSQREKKPLEAFVLSSFSMEEREKLPAFVERISEGVLSFIRDGEAKAMSFFNGRVV